jgi:hypothetical protein
MYPDNVSLLFTGHMVDLPDRVQPRFPSEAVQDVADSIRDAISRIQKDESNKAIRGFASLARGGDIIFHEICRSLSIETIIVLPFRPELFVETSVEGIKGSDWIARFKKIWGETDPGFRVNLDLPTSDQAYQTCNFHMLKLAEAFGHVRLIALWDGKAGEEGGTGDFVRKVQALSSGPHEILRPHDF